MRVLVYKRTHTGDPNESGTFGCNGCMGAVRGWDFGAVIGVGGIGSKAKKNGIAGKVTWIGIGPHHVLVRDKRGPGVQFDHFIRPDTEGEDFRKLAKKLAKRIYEQGIRTVILDPSDAEYDEVANILKLAEDAHHRRVERRPCVALVRSAHAFRVVGERGRVDGGCGPEVAGLPRWECV